jgi:NADH-quinone oxidoreductase subunit N
MTGFSILTRDFMTCLPETMILVTALVLLILGLYRGEYAFNRVMFLAKLSLATIFIVICTLPSVHLTAFQGQFISDAFAILMKAVVAGAALVTLLISHKSLTSDHITSYEYPVLILFSTLGMMIMISANDLMRLFMGLEFFIF